MNFKIGDKVIVIDNTLLSLSFNIGDKFTVIKTNNESNSIFISGHRFYYDIKHFKLDEIYYRKEKIEKINKICSNQVIK